MMHANTAPNRHSVHRPAMADHHQPVGATVRKQDSTKLGSNATGTRRSVTELDVSEPATAVGSGDGWTK